MEYISHEDYKKMLTGFGKEVPKAKLNEGLEKEGNAFTAGLAKTKRGGEFKVGDKSFKDRTNYDASVGEDYHPDDPAGQDSAAARGEDDYEGEEEGNAEVLGLVKGDIYKIKSPSGKEVDVDFEQHLEDEVDPPYAWSGWIDGSDGEYDYYMDCEFVDEGGGDYDWYPDYKSLEATPVRTTPVKEIPGFDGTRDALNNLSIKKEYQFDQMYPDDPGPFEGIEQKLKEFLAKEDDLNFEAMDDSSSSSLNFGFDLQNIQKLENYVRDNFNVIENGENPKQNTDAVIWVERGDDTMNGMDVLSVKLQKDQMFQSLLRNCDGQGDFNDEDVENEMEEDINLPSSQPTGPSIEEKRSRLAHLTSEERDQLKQYVETIRTVKEEIKKMVGKKDMEEGGDNTNLIMQPTTVSEEGGGEHEEIESNLDPKIHDAFHKVTGMAVKSLIKAGIEPDQIKAFFQHEISELPDFVSSQYEGRRASMKKNPFLEPTLKSYQDGTHKKDMKKVDDITATMEKFYKKYYPNTPRSEWNLVQMIDHPKFKG